ncbi:hypothetical protein HYV57_05025 [Candidatus Peregrinibacteria bacterium]|nr:hypothetical protein [Candidatus Peregrinibacteria bacterium]
MSDNSKPRDIDRDKITDPSEITDDNSTDDADAATAKTANAMRSTEIGHTAHAGTNNSHDFIKDIIIQERKVRLVIEQFFPMNEIREDTARNMQDSSPWTKITAKDIKRWEEIIQEHLDGILKIFCNQDENIDTRMKAGVQLLEFLEGGADETLIDPLKFLCESETNATILHIAFEAFSMIPCAKSVENMIIIAERQKKDSEIQRILCEKIGILINSMLRYPPGKIIAIRLMAIEEKIQKIALPLSRSKHPIVSKVGEQIHERLLRHKESCHTQLVYSGELSLDQLEPPSILRH